MPLVHVHLAGLKRNIQNRSGSNLDRLVFTVLAISLTFLALAICAGSSLAATGSASQGGATYQPTPATSPGLRATLSSDGRTAIAPAGAPLEVQKAIWAANKINRKPYIYGGGHATFKKISRGYDCSSTLSYALGNAGFQETTLNSTGYMSWGEAGRGQWITVYTNPGHAYAVIAGLRLDTSGPGERGPRWRGASRSSKGFRVRHPKGF